MSNKGYGISYERKRKKELESLGYTANRNRGSFGCFDIVASNTKHLLLESIKSTKQKKTYDYSFSKEIKRLQKFNNCPVGTIKRLILYARGKKRILYEKTKGYSDDWVVM